MFNKSDILKNLIEFNYFIDESTLGNFIKNWKIDAIYEDEDGVEFFDNLAIAKLKKGISLKSQGYTNEQIIYHINKLMPEKIATQKEKKEVAVEKNVSGDLQNLTIDVSSQTLQMLADAVADKITAGIKEQLLQGVSFGDKEALNKQVDELMEDNKKLSQRIEELEKSKKLSPINIEFFKKYFR